MRRSRALALATLALLAGSPACWNDGPEQCHDYPPDDPHALTVTTKRDPTGTVTTSGACTPVLCTKPLSPPASGCTEWRGEMTSTNPLDTCVVVFVGREFYDGQSFTSSARRVLSSAQSCDGGPRSNGTEL